MSAKAAARLNRLYDRIERRAPVTRRFLVWIRRPAMRLVRIPVAVLLIFGGLLSILPILGLWMLPLGLMIIAEDLPFLQSPLVRIFQWTERKWKAWRSSPR